MNTSNKIITITIIAITTLFFCQESVASPSPLLGGGKEWCCVQGSNGCLRKCTDYQPPLAPNDDNTCNPYCSPQSGGQWCTDCSGGYTPDLDEDGFPLAVSEHEEVGFQCMFIEQKEMKILDCEVYGFTCQNGTCKDSEGAEWDDTF